MPRPSVVVVCFTSFRLLEHEVCDGGELSPIVGLHRHVVAAPGLLGRLPILDELASRGVVTELRAARRRYFDVVGCGVSTGAHYSREDELVDVSRIARFS